MNKPEDIPQDVWDRAIEVELSLPGHVRGSIGDIPNLVAVRAIARAILSAVEKEREAILQFEFDLPIRQNGADMMIDIREYIRNRKGA